VDLSTILRGWMWQSAKLVWGGECGSFRFVTERRRKAERKSLTRMVANGVEGTFQHFLNLKKVENYTENEKWALQVIEELGFEKGGEADE